jgi:hypothetical protein
MTDTRWPIIPDMEALVGNRLERNLADAGYRGHNAAPGYWFRIYTAGQKRRITPQIKCEMRRRAASSRATSRVSTAWAAITWPTPAAMPSYPPILLQPPPNLAEASVAQGDRAGANTQLQRA